MKKAALIVCFLFLLGTVAWAQMGGYGMMHGSGYEKGGQAGEEEYEHGPYYGYGCGMGPYGMGYGMMGPGMMGYGGYGYGMGPYGMGYGMMGSGYGMGYGMMGPGMMGGYGMGYGMMGPGMMYSQNPEIKKYLDDTKDLRKKFHMLKFDYMEAMRDPETSREALENIRDEMRGIVSEMRKMAPKGFGY